MHGVIVPDCTGAAWQGNRDVIRANVARRAAWQPPRVVRPSDWRFDSPRQGDQLFGNSRLGVLGQLPNGCHRLVECYCLCVAHAWNPNTMWVVCTYRLGSRAQLTKKQRGVICVSAPLCVPCVAGPARRATACAVRRYAAAIRCATGCLPATKTRHSGSGKQISPPSAAGSPTAPQVPMLRSTPDCAAPAPRVWGARAPRPPARGNVPPGHALH